MKLCNGSRLITYKSPLGYRPRVSLKTTGTLADPQHNLSGFASCAKQPQQDHRSHQTSISWTNAAGHFHQGI